MKKIKQVKEHMKDVNMKRLFRRNQIIITTLAVMIAAAGYLNYAGNQELDGQGQVYEAGAMDISDEDILAENQAVMNEAGDGVLQEIPSLDDPMEGNEAQAAADEVEEALPQESLAQNDGQQEVEMAAADSAEEQAQAEGSQAGLENPGEAVLTSGMNVADYIANVQLNREQIRAKNKETLMGLINSTSIDEAAKQQAIQDMIDLTEIAEKENAAETLLMAKGFLDPVVSITGDKVDVVINASSITDPQRAQIEDIVKRKTEVGADQIVITLLLARQLQ